MGKKGIDPLKSDSKARERRNLIHRHNGLGGSVIMSKVQMDAIIGSQTASAHAKQLAREAWAKLDELWYELKDNRVMPGYLKGDET